MTTEYQTHLTLKSSNRKVGPIPVSTTTARTCPDACPLKRSEESGVAGCYADGGPMGMFWRKVTELRAGVSFEAFLKQVSSLPTGQLWRHNQAGDLPGNKKKLDNQACTKLAKANKGKRGFTYCHYDPLESRHNRRVLKRMNDMGFTVNLSGNNPEHADMLADLGIAPVTTLLPSDQTENSWTPQGRKIVLCPPTTKKHANVSCADCQLCQRRNRKIIIGFPTHGSSKRKAEINTANQKAA